MKVAKLDKRADGSYSCMVAYAVLKALDHARVRLAPALRGCVVAPFVFVMCSIDTATIAASLDAPLSALTVSVSSHLTHLSERGVSFSRARCGVRVPCDA